MEDAFSEVILVIFSFKRLKPSYFTIFGALKLGDLLTYTLGTAASESKERLRFNN